MSRNLNDLHPYAKYLAETFIEKCRRHGIEVLIYGTYRSREEQNKLYAQGRSKPGIVVTNARGGYSYHNYRLAFDCVAIMGNKAQWGRVDLYEKMGTIGKSIGLEWGGDFKSIKDRPHFQWDGGFTLKQLRQGLYPADPRKKTKTEFEIAIDKLVEMGVVNSPDYWIKKETYKTEYVQTLIKRVVKKIG